MQLKDIYTIKLSEDTGDSPVEIAFSTVKDIVDTTSVTKSAQIHETFAIGTTSIDVSIFNSIKFLFVRPANDVVVTIDGEDLTLKGGKDSKLWLADSSTISLTVAGATNRVYLLVGGT